MTQLATGLHPLSWTKSSLAVTGRVNLRLENEFARLMVIEKIPGKS
jgi:hypothetical protein